LSKKDVIEGKGPTATNGAMVTVSYVGKIGSKVFDQHKSFTFRLGRGEVIKGWDLGVKGMKVGGKRILDVPPELGYGKKRAGPIPPNSQLTFEVELKRVG
jgi:FKBP-type peptidyl-prolyl cis-trans isomerase